MVFKSDLDSEVILYAGGVKSKIQHEHFINKKVSDLCSGLSLFRQIRLISGSLWVPNLWNHQLIFVLSIVPNMLAYLSSINSASCVIFPLLPPPLPPPLLFFFFWHYIFLLFFHTRHTWNFPFFFVFRIFLKSKFISL